LRILRLGGDIVLSSDIALWQRSLAKSCRLLIGYGSTEVPTVFQWFVPGDWTAMDRGYPSDTLSRGHQLQYLGAMAIPRRPECSVN
jgi:hypothetical protein